MKKSEVKVGIIFENRQKKTAVSPQLKKVLRQVCEEVLRQEGLDGLFEVSVSFVDDGQIRELNKQFRNMDKPTDVLSFPLSENGVTFDVNGGTGAKLLGDIVISLERAASQAEEYGHSFMRETAFLTAHSMLHLLGYDHEEGSPVSQGKAAAEMREREERALEKLGLTREDGDNA